jgi:hypothetical protein
MSSALSSPVTPDDDAFVVAFSAGQIPNDGFRHRDHLRLAWVQIHRLGVDAALGAVTTGIRQFATHHGRADRYHDTMTRFWVRAMSLGINRHQHLTFDDLLAAEPHLLDKTLPGRHWSSTLMGRPEARTRWVEPDLHPMPAA